jgi:hypothetical protein
LATGPKSDRRPRLLKVVVGMLVAGIGAALIGGLQFIADDLSPSSDRLVFALGLGLTALLWAGAQCLILIGAAIMWSEFKPRHWRA